jgi:prephenate dehydrogenase
MMDKKITIIGGSGGMGRVFGRYFKNHGFQVILNARNEERLKHTAKELGVDFEIDIIDSVKDADMVMITIPINSTPKMIEKVAPELKKNALLFDITSLKTTVYKTLEEMKNKYPINCLSLHPMFGPGITDMKNYVMVVLKVGGTEKYTSIVNELLNLFKSDGLIITETAPKIHDLRIALTLGVPHMINIIFLNLLKRSNESLSELTRFTGTTFLLQKVFAESIIQREMEMFGEIEIENQEFLKILELFENIITEYKTIIQNKDLEGFKRLFIEGLNYSKEDDHFKNSYKYFYEFMKILKKNK